MILNDKSIKERKLVIDGRSECYRAASYDLTAGTIVAPDGKVVDEYSLPPQGVVKVISAETVNIPTDITAYVHVKTGLCNEGILALNIGIVDPGFVGPLQSALINFGKTAYELKKGSVFSRITFHQQQPSSSAKDVHRTIAQVTDEAKTHVRKYLAHDFLNFSKTVKKAAKKATESYRRNLFIYVPALALLLAFFTFLLNFANMSRLESYINVKDRAVEAREKEDMVSKLETLGNENDGLRRELGQLKVQFDARAVSQTSKPQQKSEVPKR